MTVRQFVFTGAGEGFTVPIGVTSITVEAWGGHGGAGDHGLIVPLPNGGHVKATFAVTPGQICYVHVGDNGTPASNTNAPGGYPDGGAGTPGNANSKGGAGGGGSTDFRISTNNLAGQQLGLVAAGGGGLASVAAGVALTVGDGSGYPSSSCPWDGSPATVSAGGAGGVPPTTGIFGTYNDIAASWVNGNAGGRYSGAAAPNPAPRSSWTSPNQPGLGDQSGSRAKPWTATAGGGGGGYYGGGSGGATTDNLSGAGAAGSNYVSSSATAVTNNAAANGYYGGNAWVNGLLTITYSLPPAAPALAQPFNGAQVDSTQPVTMAWTNPALPEPGDAISGYEIQYRNVGDTDWTSLGQVTSTATSVTEAVGTFTPGAQVEWQVRSKGTLTVNYGPWSASYFFTMLAPPPAPTITAPAAGSTLSASPVTLSWSPVAGQQSWEARRTDSTAGTTVYWDSGVNAAPGSSVSVPLDTVSRTDHLQVRVMVSGLWSPWADETVTVAILPPHVPVIAAVADSVNAQITASVYNPAVLSRTLVNMDPSLEKFVASSPPTANDNLVSAVPDTTVKLSGTQSIKLTGVTAGSLWYHYISANQSTTNPGYNKFDAATTTAGYLIRAKVRLAPGSPSGALTSVCWQNNWYGGGSSVSPYVTLLQGVWTDVVYWMPTSVIPTAAYLGTADAFSFLYLVGVDAIKVGDVVNIDQLQVEPLTTAQLAAQSLNDFPYFDGSTLPAYGGGTVAWTGTANASKATYTDTSAVVDHNEIWRSEPNKPEIRIAKAIPPNGSFTDKTPAHKIVYSYRAVALAVTGAGVSS